MPHASVTTAYRHMEAAIPNITRRLVMSNAEECSVPNLQHKYPPEQKIARYGVAVAGPNALGVHQGEEEEEEHPCASSPSAPRRSVR